MGGWSKGCFECRKRKVKCDQQQPQCENCMKREVPCSGYEGLRVIAYKKQPQTRSNQSVRPQPSRNARQVTVVDPGQTVSSGPVFRNQVMSSFCHLHFPISERKNQFKVDVFPSLFTDIAALPRKSFMLELAISAISCVFLGKIDGNDQMLQHGLQLYNNAIGYVFRALSQTAYSEELLYTSMICQEIEAIHSPQSLEAYVMHVKGIGSMLRQYRPQVLANPLTAAIYHKHYKVKVFITKYLTMSEAEYKYLSQPAQNDPMLELIHIVADVSFLYRESGPLRASESEACQNLLFQSLDQKSKLLAWYSRWEESIGQGWTTYRPGELKSKLSWRDDLFGPAYRFSSLDNAKLHMFFWIGSAILYPLIHRAQHLVLSQGADLVNNDFLREEQSLAITYADKIARSLPYCAQAEMHARGMYAGVAVAQHLAMIYSQARCWDKFVWTKSVFLFMADCGKDVAARRYEAVSKWWPSDCPQRQVNQSHGTGRVDLQQS